MGNSLGGKKTVKIMKISGETLKLKTPVKAGEVIKDYPGLVLLDSEGVKHYGVRVKALELHQNLVPKRLYLLVELPKATTEKPRRVRSGINMSAKDRLESLMLARRSASDLSIMKGNSSGEEDNKNGGTHRVKLRLTKAEVEKLIHECNDEPEVAVKIMNLCIANHGQTLNSVSQNGQHDLHWNSHGSATKPTVKARKKRVSFEPVSETEMQIAVASY